MLGHDRPGVCPRRMHYLYSGRAPLVYAGVLYGLKWDPTLRDRLQLALYTSTGNLSCAMRVNEV